MAATVDGASTRTENGFTFRTSIEERDGKKIRVTTKSKPVVFHVHTSTAVQYRNTASWARGNADTSEKMETVKMETAGDSNDSELSILNKELGDFVERQEQRKFERELNAAISHEVDESIAQEERAATSGDFDSTGVKFNPNRTSGADNESRTLNVSNLPLSVTARELSEFFGSHQPYIQNIKIITRERRGATDRVAFVDFKERVFAERAMEEMNNQPLGNLMVILEWARQGGRRPPRDFGGGAGGGRGFGPVERWGKHN